MTVLYLPIPKDYQVWLEHHAVQGQDGIWRCRKTGEFIKTEAKQRQVRYSRSKRKDRRIRLDLLDHPYCSCCQPDPLAPNMLRTLKDFDMDRTDIVRVRMAIN